MLGGPAARLPLPGIGGRVAIVALALTAVGCGAGPPTRMSGQRIITAPALPKAHPQAIQPVALGPAGQRLVGHSELGRVEHPQQAIGLP
jgi:hypothetical protein